MLFASLTVNAETINPINDTAISKRSAAISSSYEWPEFLHRQMIEFVEKENIPNAVIALVMDGDIRLLQGYGLANMESGIPVDASKHLFRTGSVAKVFTWAAVMQLYEQGLLDLNTDINQYLDFELKSRVRYKSKNPEPITLSHLMTHTAGFEDVLQGLFSFDLQPPIKEYLEKNSPARIYPPGTVMAYCNYGTTLAGYIVEQLSGLAYEEYVKEHIFEPLGMNRSTFLQPLPANLEADIVTAYRYVDGEFLPGNFEYMPAPAGGLSTTSLDMATFMIANLNQRRNKSGSLLKQGILKEMHAPLFQYHPRLAGMAHGLMVSNYYGQRIVQHSGSSSVFDAGFYLLPDLNTGVFIAYSGGSYDGHIKIFSSFMDTFLAVDARELSAPEPIFTPDLKSLSGEYHQSRKAITNSNRVLNLVMGRMHLKLNQEGQIVFRLYDQDYVFEEVTPGVYRSTKINTGYPFGPMDYMMATKSPDGRLMLVTDGPMTYIKARWYETASFAGLIFLPVVLLAAGSLLFFFVRFIIRKIKRNPQQNNRPLRLLNRIIIAHAISLIALLVLFIAGNEPHPVHLLPASFFKPNPAMDFMLTLITFIIIGLGLLYIWFIIARGKQNSGFSKIYYSAYALWSAGLIWLFWYYNLLSL